MALGPTWKDSAVKMRGRCGRRYRDGFSRRMQRMFGFRKLGSTPPSLSNPDVVCYLSIASETQHANRFQSRSENVMAFYVE